MRGRPRKLDPTMPRHIDPRRLPAGAYWDGRDRVWYTILREPKATRKRIADAKATVADLHRILEDMANIDRGTVAHVLDQFHGSEAFLELKPKTRQGYDAQRRLAIALRTGAGPFGKLHATRLTLPGMQALMDKVADGTRVDDDGKKVRTPTKANHLLRYLRRVFSWAMTRGHVLANPFKGIEEAKERKLRRRPDPGAVIALTRFAKACGARPAHTLGSCAPYLWIVIEISYLARLRGIETLTLTDDEILPQGLRTNRRKGSNDNIVEWNPRLRAAVDAALALRKQVSTAATVVTLRRGARDLIVAQDGGPLSKNGLDSAFQRLMLSAIETGVLKPAQRFGLHDMKRKGISDTTGTRGEKQLASGHKTESMLAVYDYSVPIVKPSGE